MNVTRDVIYDLLPAYFAGEASADSKAVIEAFFETDPEFARMAQRFQRMREQPSASARQAAADQEWRAFEHFRARERHRNAATMWAMGALIAFLSFMAMPGARGPTLRHPGATLTVVFGALAVVKWRASRATPRAAPR